MSDENPFAGIAKACTNDSTWSSHLGASPLNVTSLELMQRLYDQIANEPQRPSIEIVGRSEAFYRSRENPGAGKAEWFD